MFAHSSVSVFSASIPASSPALGRQRVQQQILCVAILVIFLLLTGCVVPPVVGVKGSTAEEVARQQRLERAQNNLADGLKRYEAGAYDESMRSFLLALDSGVLTIAQQITARKNMAFTHCVNNREAACKEEFEKAFALDAKFDLPAAEAGHPTWGPIFRLVKTEIELRNSGRSLPAPLKPPTAGEKLMADGAVSYDAADYPKAIKTYQEALKETLVDTDQIRAHKFLAFSYCLSNRVTLCRAEFEKVFQLKADFDLEPAEAGHPSWGPSFRTVKAKQKNANPATPAKK